MKPGFDVEDCVCIKETDKALLIRMGPDKVWIPKSQVTSDSEIQGEGDDGTLSVTEWFATKSGWI